MYVYTRTFIFRRNTRKSQDQYSESIFESSQSVVATQQTVSHTATKSGGVKKESNAYTQIWSGASFFEADDRILVRYRVGAIDRFSFSSLYNQRYITPLLIRYRPEFKRCRDQFKYRGKNSRHSKLAINRLEAENERNWSIIEHCSVGVYFGPAGTNAVLE